jgi:3-hydroxyisobutyrate dehydrogenase-like beta-hydroxyacid dehydrogenase
MGIIKKPAGKRERSMTNKNVGIVGLGLLGSALAERLLDAGYRILGHDLRLECRQKLDAIGGVSCDSATDVFASSEIVILSLPTSGIVGELLARTPIPANRVIVDTTTGNPEDAADHVAALRSVDGEYIEANVAGSSVQAARGQAVIFLGSDVEPRADVVAVLEALSTRRFSVGPVGAASRFKLVHNLLLGLHRAVLAEGLNFAQAMGFDQGKTLEILQATPAASAVMPTKGPKMVDGDFSPQATLSQHLKDVGLIVELAEKYGVEAPLSEQHRLLLEQAESLGWGRHDNSAVIQAYRGERND